MLAPPSLNLPPKEDAIFALGRFVCQSALGPNPCRAELEAFRPAGLRAVDPEGRLVRGLLLALAPADARAQGFEGADFALRYFSPWNGIEEDPATGSAQCMAAPYWARRLGKCRLRGEQRPNPSPRPAPPIMTCTSQITVLQCFPGRGAEFEAVLDEQLTEQQAEHPTAQHPTAHRQHPTDVQSTAPPPLQLFGRAVTVLAGSLRAAA